MKVILAIVSFQGTARQVKKGQTSVCGTSEALPMQLASSSTFHSYCDYEAVDFGDYLGFMERVGNRTS